MRTNIRAVLVIFVSKTSAIGKSLTVLASHNYQFAWNPNPTWSSFYASHDEILQYLEDCIDRFELNRYIKTGHSVKGAVWDNDAGIWTVTILDEEKQTEFQDTCNFLVDGSGILKYISQSRFIMRLTYTATGNGRQSRACTVSKAPWCTVQTGLVVWI